MKRALKTSTSPSRFTFQVPHNSPPSPPRTMASSYMAPRNLEDYSKLIRFSKEAGYLYRLTKTSSSSETKDTPLSTSRGSSDNNLAGRVWKKRFLVLNDGYLYTFHTKEESQRYDFKQNVEVATSSSSNSNSNIKSTSNHRKDSVAASTSAPTDGVAQSKDSTSSSSATPTSNQPISTSTTLSTPSPYDAKIKKTLSSSTFTSSSSTERGRPNTLELARLLKVGTTSRYKNEEHCFQLQMANGQRLVLRAETRAERDAWLFAFHRSIAKIISMLLSSTSQIPRNGLGGSTRGRGGGGGGGGGGPLALSLDRQTSVPASSTEFSINTSALEARKDKERSLSGDSAVSPTSTQRRQRGATTDSIGGVGLSIDASSDELSRRDYMNNSNNTNNNLSTMPRSIVRKVTRLDHESRNGVGSDGSLAGSSGGSSGDGGNRLSTSLSTSPLIRSPRAARMRERRYSGERNNSNDRYSHSSEDNGRDGRDGRDSRDNDATINGWTMEGTPPTSPKSDAVSERSSIGEGMFDFDLDDSMGNGTNGDSNNNHNHGIGIGGRTPPQVQYSNMMGGGMMGSAEMMSMMGGVGSGIGSRQMNGDNGSADTPDTPAHQGHRRRTTPSVIKWELSSGVSSIIGRRPTMEDVHVVIDCMGLEEKKEKKNLNANADPNENETTKPEETKQQWSDSTFVTNGPRTAFYAVYDGHSGVMAAEFVSSRLLELLSNDPLFWDEKSENVILSLKNNFQIVDDEYLKKCDLHNQQFKKKNGEPDNWHEKWMCAGTTAVVCVVRSGHLWVATLGDSAAMLGRDNDTDGINTGIECKSIMLSNAQTPGREDEVERITKAGGWVKEDRELYLSRLHDMDLQDPFIKSYAEQKVGMVSIHRVNGEISVSRAFGDPDYKVGHGLETYGWNWPKDHNKIFTGDLIIAT